MNKKEKATLVLTALLKASAYVLVYFASQVLVGAIVGVVLAFTGTDAGEFMNTKIMELQTFANVISVLCCIWLTRLMSKQGAGEGFRLNVDFAKRGKILALCIAIGVFGQYVLTFLINVVIKFPQAWQDALEENSELMGQSSFTALFVAVAIVAPLAEEIIFRACVQGTLQTQIPKWCAILIASLVFGVMHGNPIGIIYATLLGIFMGWLFAELDSIIPSMLFHFAFNLTSVFITSLSPVIFVISILCLALSVGYLIYLFVQNRKNPPLPNDFKGDNNEAL